MNPSTDTTEEDFSPYQITSRREIISLLRNLCSSGQLIQMKANDGKESAITSVLEVDDDSGQVILDCASSAVINQRLTESEDIAFDTALDSIRILFNATGIESCVHDDRPALCIDLPESVIRLQRREYYRVKTPVANPVRCVFRVETENDGSKTVALPLYNVSGGGIAVVDEKKLLEADFGHVFHDCRVELPGSPVVVNLQLRSAQNLRLTNGKHVCRMGFEFVDPSPATMSAIQRYITKLEREQNARATGMG